MKLSILTESIPSEKIDFFLSSGQTEKILIDYWTNAEVSGQNKKYWEVILY